MRFGQQKFLIVVLFMALPLLAIFSLIESPMLSQSLLKFSLRYLNFRTGVSVSAKSWNLHPTTFSASLSEIDFSTGGVYFRAKELELQLSPVDLIFGVAKFRNISINELILKGKVPEKWFEADPNNPGPKLNELPEFTSKHLQEINDLLAKQKLGITELGIKSANFDFSNLKVKDLNVRIVNQSRGQARLDLSLASAELPGRIAPTPRVEVSLSLVRETQSSSLFLVRNLILGDQDKTSEAIVLSGRVPGRISSTLNLDLTELNSFLKKGSWTTDLHHSNLSGIVSGSLSFDFQSENSWQLFVEEISIFNLVYDEYKLNRFDLSFDLDAKDKLTLRRANFTLPASLSDPSAWKQSLSIQKLVIGEAGRVSGELAATELGLCSVMIATGVDECFASVQINGPAAFSGTLDPLKLNLKTEWSLSPATVYSDPEVPGKRGTDPLLHTNEATFVADIMIFDKYLAITASEAKWGDSAISIKGEVKYIPTNVELDLVSKQVELSNIISKFLDLPVSGVASIKSQILYDYAIPKRADRTKVLGALEIDKFQYGGQLIGQLNAPLLYEAGDLNIGPASLASGGGTAILRGVLQNRPEGKSRLEASATMRRFETSILSGSGDPVVRGFYTGVFKVDGYLNETAAQTGLRGRISGALDSAEVLGIGLSRVEGLVSLKGSDLVLEELVGQKNKKKIRATGLISATEGLSYVDFEGADLDVVGLGWDSQIESLFNSGRVSINGRWSDKDGYSINGVLSELSDSTNKYGDGLFVAIGDDKELNFNVELKSGFFMKAKSTYSGSGASEQLNFNEVEVRLKNKGLFLGLSYLNEWKEKIDLVTTGSLDLKYTQNSGFLNIDNLKFRRASPTSNQKDILSIEGQQQINWEKNVVNGKSFKVNGALLDLRVNPAHKGIEVSGSWSSELMDLVIPDFVRLRDGYAKGSLALGLPFSFNTLRGRLDINGVSLGVEGLGRYGQNTTGSLEFKESRILFNRLRSNFGTGYADVSGEYKIDWQNPGVFLNVELMNAEFVFLNEVPAVTSGSIVLSGNSYPFDVRGRVSIDEGLYAAETSAAATSDISSGDPILNFDIAIDLGSRFAVRNELISTNVTGAMKLIGTDIAPSFVGVVQLEDGRVFARDNEFQVVRGVVDFPANSPNVFINITAVTEIKTATQTYSITLNATGTTDKPNIEFQSNPTLALPDIASLLAFGVVRSEESDDVGSSSLADTARAEALQTIFGKTIGSTLRQKAGLDVRVSARAALDREQTIPKVTVVRKLSKKVTATFGRSLDFSRPENNVQLDYELLRNVNVSGVWENPNPKESSVGVDLRFRWDVK
jgi:hypothetical protein